MERPEDGTERPEGNAQLEGNEVPVVGLGWQDGMMGCIGVGSFQDGRIRG